MKIFEEQNRKVLTANDSRRQAREMMRELYPDFNWRMYYVHHLDGNPLNNDLSNLCPVHRQGHTFLHSMIKKHNLL